ncbi:glycosyltransferase family 2 protein [Mycolicibacterium sp. P1-18]|uniref:glycosyltransferase family 2 protein n=1 Tax=Mycolicibacterium sp. P1-18 TaxID=2024615 RepID=UPI0015637D3E|nr:glycosyltransferase family 2 protein [Mycolicibacterium sp. P1-18]
MVTESRTSFVIASRNRSSELAVVVKRLLDTTTCPIVLVDNASDDDSVLVSNGLASESGGRVDVVALPENLGAVGRNVGVARCATPFVAFCDDDSWWEPEATEIAEELFDAHRTLALLAGRTVVWPGQRDDPMVELLATSPLGHDPALPGPSILGFLACSAMVRKTAFEAVGGFSPILHFRGEERLLAWDLAAHGWDLCFSPRLVAHHQPSTVRPPSSVQKARSTRNDVLTTWLRRPAQECVSAGVEFVRIAAVDRAHAKALGEALRLLPMVARQRRLLPPEVEASLAKLATA